MPAKLVRFFLPRIEYILFAGIFLGIASNGPRILNFDGDLPRHILSGNLILQTHLVHTTDIFSFRTAGVPSIPHEWLSQVLFAASYDLLDLSGVVLLTALIIMVTWGLVYYQTFYKSNSFLLSLLFTALAVGTSQIHVLPRPHIFSYLLTAVWIALLERTNKETRAWWMLPLIMLLWVNLHGMFVLGILIGGIYLAGDFLDQPSKSWFASPKAKGLMLGVALSILATFVSPSGPKIWEAIASLGSNAYITSKIPEYQSANFHLPWTWPFIILLLLCILGFARSKQNIRWADVLLVIAFTGLALYTSRLIPLFAIVVTPIAAKAIADWMHSDYPGSRFFTTENNIHKINSSSNGLIWIFALIIALTVLFNLGKAIDPENRGNTFDDRFFPVEATSWLKSHPQQGKMLNEFDWGGYLLLRLWPHQQIFMDGHTHIYGEALTREYEQVITLSMGWESILKKYNIEWVILRVNSPLSNALISSDDWVIAYQDQTAVILTRK
jgi:hypothetical protein